MSSPVRAELTLGGCILPRPTLFDKSPMAQSRANELRGVRAEMLLRMPLMAAARRVGSALHVGRKNPTTEISL
jgi:hypothetical protein